MALKAGNHNDTDTETVRHWHFCHSTPTIKYANVSPGSHIGGLFLRDLLYNYKGL